MKTLHLWRVFLAISVVILMANVLFVDWIWLKDRQRFDGVVDRVNQLTTAFNSLGMTEEAGESGKLNNTTPPTSLSTDELRGCGSVCQGVIEKKVTEAIDSLQPSTSSVSTTPKTQLSAESSTLTTVMTRTGSYYIPLSGTGSTKERDWVSIPTTETDIDWSEYGNNYTVTWDAYAKVFQGNGKVYLRLYDKTNGVEVSGSGLDTGSETSVHLVSSPLTVWTGKNTYVVQVKTLTGYEGFFEGGRIKVVVK